MCICYLGHLPHHPLPVSPDRMFCPLVLQFCWRKNIKDNKNMVFLLVWDEGREVPCVVSMHMCVTIQTGASLPDLFTTS
jgi:hypothetical protein